MYLLYSLLFFTAYLLFWVVVYGKVVKFYIIKLPGMSTITYIAVIGGGFVLAFVFWWLMDLPPEPRSVAVRVLPVLLLVPVPFILYFLVRKGRSEVKVRADEIQNKIAGLGMRLERDPEDWGVYLALAKVYDKQNRLEEAIEAYCSALALMGSSPIRAKTEAKVEFLQRLLEKRKAERTLICSQCGTKNLPKNRTCCNCQAPLYRTVFHWMSDNLDLRVKYVLLAVVVVFSIFFFWVNPVFVILLILLWCFDIIYFCLPVEFTGGGL